MELDNQLNILKQKTILKSLDAFPSISFIIKESEVILYPKSKDIYEHISSGLDYYSDALYNEIYPYIKDIFKDDYVYLYIYAGFYTRNPIQLYPIFKLSIENFFMLENVIKEKDVFNIIISDLSLNKIIEIANVDNAFSDNLREISVKGICYK